MPSSAADVATGLTVGFGTHTSVDDLQVISVTLGGISRPALATSHLGTTAVGSNEMSNATFIPGRIVDGGEMTLEVHWNPDKIIPFEDDDTGETITITTLEGATVVFSGFVTGFEINAPLDEVMTATITVKVSGAATVTAVA